MAITINMVTTIQVRGSTKQMLEELKLQSNAENYDEVISKIIAEKLKAPKSLFGKIKLSPYVRRKDRMKFRE